MFMFFIAMKRFKNVKFKYKSGLKRTFSRVKVRGVVNLEAIAKRGKMINKLISCTHFPSI